MPIETIGGDLSSPVPLGIAVLPHFGPIVSTCRSSPRLTDSMDRGSVWMRTLLNAGLRGL